MNPIIDEILKNIEDQTLAAAKQAGVNAGALALEDAKTFLVAALPRLTRWVTAYFDKTITADEFQQLLWMLKDLALMHAMTAGGIAEVEVDKTRNVILQTLTSVATNAVGKLI